MSVWLAALIFVVTAGGLEGARRSWNRRGTASIEDIGASLATARAKQRQLLGQADIDRVSGSERIGDSAPTTTPAGRVAPDAEFRRKRAADPVDDVTNEQ